MNARNLSEGTLSTFLPLMASSESPIARSEPWKIPFGSMAAMVRVSSAALRRNSMGSVGMGAASSPRASEGLTNLLIQASRCFSSA